MKILFPERIEIDNQIELESSQDLKDLLELKKAVQIESKKSELGSAQQKNKNNIFEHLLGQLGELEQKILSNEQGKTNKVVQSTKQQLNQIQQGYDQFLINGNITQIASLVAQKNKLAESAKLEDLGNQMKKDRPFISGLVDRANA